MDTDEVFGEVFDTNSLERLQLLGYALSEKLQFFPKYNTALIALSLEELNRFNFKKGDTEGLVNYGLSIKGVDFATLITEDPKLIKMSFRSKGEFSVNQFARENFEGGGHTNAAGGKSNLTLDETVRKFIDLLPKYRDN